MPGWGYQLDAERVLREAAELGLRAVEAGPEGFLPPEPAEASRLLSEHGLTLVGGFIPALLHRPEVREAQLDHLEEQVGLFAAAGAEVVVLAASTGRDGYEEAVRRRLYRPLGEGDVNLRRVLELLEEVGYEGWYVLEQDVMLDAKPDAGGPYEVVRKSLEYLSRITS